MSDFTREELDDLDSAIGDSIYTVTQAMRDPGEEDEDGRDDENQSYIDRLNALRDKIAELMASGSPTE